MSKSDWFCIYLTPHDWLRNSPQLVLQSEVKRKPVVTYSHTFSRALRQLHVITSSFDWCTGFSVSFVIGYSGYFGFCVTTLSWKLLNLLRVELQWMMPNSKGRGEWGYLCELTHHAVQHQLTNNETCLCTSQSKPRLPTPGYRWGLVLIVCKKRLLPHHVGQEIAENSPPLQQLKMFLMSL